jgi:hypothetical protein
LVLEPEGGAQGTPEAGGVANVEQIGIAVDQRGSDGQELVEGNVVIAFNQNGVAAVAY